MKVVNETITMDTPQQEVSEAINILVTELSFDYEYTKDNFKELKMI